MTEPRVSAARVARRAHEGQWDRDGNPHIEHVERVVAMVPDFAARVAWLHDVLEDSPAFGDEVETMVSPEETQALRLLTRREGEGYTRYIDRIIGDASSAGTLARTVKEADLVENLGRCLAAQDPTAHRYKRALQRLWSTP